MRFTLPADRLAILTATCLALLTAPAALSGCSSEQAGGAQPGTAADEAAPDPEEPAAEAAAGEAGSELLDGRPLPPTAHPEVLRDLRESEAASPSPADGRGEATVEPNDPVPAGSSGSWTITYTAGPDGIAAGGAVVLHVSPFWDWSDPQSIYADFPGYTTVASSASGVRLVPELCGTGCLRIGIEDAPLPAAAQLRIRYGAEGPGAARVDRLAEREEEFFLRIDGDGDGVTAPLADPPTIDIQPGPPQRVHVLARSTAAVGETVWVNVAFVDARWNYTPDFQGEVEIIAADGLEGLPERIELNAEDRGTRRIEARAVRPGVTHVTVRVPEWGATWRSNPIDVQGEEDAPRVYWADLHGHSALSDGTGQPDEYFTYARDVAALEIASLTDHDHWGLRFLDRDPELFESIRDAVGRFHEPGRFVTLLGYEWTSWIFGHRHVLYFGEEGEVFGFSDRASDEPEELWALLEEQGLPAITIPHHPAGGPVAIDWSVAPHPRFEPVVEISSVHGTSECLQCPSAIYEPVEGTFVRDALDRGYRLGIVGSGDTHDGHPGLGSPEDRVRGRTIGLAGVLADGLSREAVLAALRERRVYATSGPRIVLRFAVSGAPMGGTLQAGDGSEPRVVYARAVGTAPIERIDVVKNGEVAFSLEGDGREQLELLAEDASDAGDGDYLYARVVQEDGGLAWSSPVWIKLDNAR